MGSGASANTGGSITPNIKSKSNGKVGRSTQDIVALLMPVYFVEEEPTQKDIDLAGEKWSLIIDDKSPHFQRKKGQPGFTQSSCIMLFYDSFYSRLFDIHPMSKPMFKAGLKSQGKFLVKMISLSLTILLDKPKFEDTMTKLAEVHNNRGVKSVEYGIVGDVLFWSLRRCLGADYDAPCHIAWVRIFCTMLKAIVPIAIQWELKNGDAQIDRLRVRPPEESNSEVSGASGDSNNSA